MVGLPDGEGRPFRSWCPAALADGQIYLFDSRLGLPLPSQTGGEVATLAQVKTRAELLRPFSAADLPYDVDFAQARQAEPLLACPLSALAPRMRRLEARLAETNRPHLAAEPVALLKQFGDALQKSGLADCQVHVWGPTPNRDDELQVLRSFLSPEEGGTDRPLEGQRWDPRRQRFDESLTPWQFLPNSVRLLPEGSDLGPRLRQGFAKPFLDLAHNPRMPHELMLRGQLDEAVAGFVEMRGVIERLRETVRTEANPTQVLELWVEESRGAYAELLRAQREAARGKDAAAPAALKAARTRMIHLWEQQRAEKPLEVLQSAAAGAAPGPGHLLPGPGQTGNGRAGTDEHQAPAEAIACPRGGTEGELASRGRLVAKVPGRLSGSAWRGQCSPAPGPSAGGTGQARSGGAVARRCSGSSFAVGETRLPDTGKVAQKTMTFRQAGCAGLLTPANCTDTSDRPVREPAWSTPAAGWYRP